MDKKKSESERGADYLQLATQMRMSADRAFDPQVAAEYLALAVKYLRLAEEAQRHRGVIDRSEGDGDDPRTP